MDDNEKDMWSELVGTQQQQPPSEEMIYQSLMNFKPAEEVAI